MVISITDLKRNLLAVVRELEATGVPVDIARHGRVVAHLVPALRPGSERPWERLRGTGELMAAPEESVVEDAELDALR